MEMREAAERVLFGRSLDEKLQLPPLEALDTRPGKAIVVPQDGPGRPPELKISEKGVKVKFPGVNRLDRERERGVLMHFLANHELLAAELMALVLLKFPNAPAEYRAGVYEAMREEQMHTMMYLRRMSECGVGFGDLPLNDYFWRMISGVESPLEFVTRLNLTFEQANLDFSKHYAALFRQVGDNGTAAVLEKIYLDEIGHVGHGLKWFRHWKADGLSDWKAFCDLQGFPFSPARAKGVAPFNAEGRRVVGFDEEFIAELEVFEQSRGRTPVVAWFNSEAESRVMEVVSGNSYTPNKRIVALERDLEIAALSWCRKDDVLLMRRRPSMEHLRHLREAGLELPQVVVLDDLDQLKGRKIGGLRPWAWSPDAAKLLAGMTLPERVRWKWREALPAEWFSKALGYQLEGLLGNADLSGVLCRDMDSAMAALRAGLKQGEVLIKALHACAGRGHRVVDDTMELAATEAWLRRTIEWHGGVVVEPRLIRVLDFSSLYEVEGSSKVRWLGMGVMDNDSAGRFQGVRVGRKWGNMLDRDVAEFAFREAGVMELFGKRVPDLLGELLPGYVGPVGVDAMIHRGPAGELRLRPVVEVNVRMTMGRVALELQGRLGQGGKLSILRKGGVLPQGALVLNDPEQAEVALLVWESHCP